MSEKPETNIRLKKAVNSVAAPPHLEARIRSRIRAENSADGWLEDRSAANSRLKAAVRNIETPPFLEARIRHSVRTERLPTRWLPRLVPAAVAAGAVVALLITYQLGHLRLTVRSQQSYIASVSTRIPMLMRVGLGDHIHCSVFRKYPKNPPAVEQFVHDLTPQYAGLIPIVRKEVPKSYRMSLAHLCRYNGRRFVHLSLMNDSNMMSLVMTRKSDGESFNTETMMPALVQAGIPMYQAGVQRFQMSAFETRDYLVYFISDMSKQQNTDMMLALAPQVKDFLNKLEL